MCLCYNTWQIHTKIQKNTKRKIHNGKIVTGRKKLGKFSSFSCVGSESLIEILIILTLEDKSQFFYLNHVCIFEKILNPVVEEEKS